MPASSSTELFRRLERDDERWRDFAHLCGLGGRIAGGAGDRAAADHAADALARIGARVTRVEIPFDAWHATRATLRAGGADWACRAFLRSAATPPGGLTAEVVNVGRGTEADFARAGVTGKIALARHEYPFSAEHLHRRRKYQWALAQGAVGFLLANPDGGLLSGSSGRARDAAGIPAAYIDAHAASAVTRAARATLAIDGIDRSATAPVVIADCGDPDGPTVVLSAHLDGHDIGQSALDNASGVAVALSVARALAGTGVALRVALFSAEEWALTGSARWLADLAPTERARMCVNINLDTVGGDDSLTALTSGFEATARLTARAATLAGVPVAVHAPLMENSDHANFARAGIPALRLIAGFGRSASNVRHILSAEDTIDKVQPDELTRAAIVAAAMVLEAQKELGPA